MQKEDPVPQGDDAVTLAALPGHGGAGAADSSAWDAHRLRRLSEVQRLILKVDDAMAQNKEQADDLLASVKSALSALGIVGLRDDGESRTADGVLLLRSEPDTTLVGAIFATMRDRDGTFLWASHAGCRIKPDDGRWGETFNDASERLISKLPMRPKVSAHLSQC